MPQHGEKVEVFTDGNDDYVYGLPSYFAVEDLNYGQLVKLRNDKGRLIGKERRVIFGDPDVVDIETTMLRILTGFCVKGWVGLSGGQSVFRRRSSVCNVR